MISLLNDLFPSILAPALGCWLSAFDKSKFCGDAYPEEGRQGKPHAQCLKSQGKENYAVRNTSKALC
jgi:hypothetical protein